MKYNTNYTNSMRIPRKGMKKENGYIAITTAIIVSFIILIIATTLGTSALLSRMNELDFSYKKITYYASRSCLDYALLKLASDINYLGNETVPIGSYNCVLSAIEDSGNNKILRSKVQDSYSGATTNLKLTLDRYALTTILLEEPVSF